MPRRRTNFKVEDVGNEFIEHSISPACDALHDIQHIVHFPSTVRHLGRKAKGGKGKEDCYALQKPLSGENEDSGSGKK